MEKWKRFLSSGPVALLVGLAAFLNPFLFYLSTDFHGCFADVVPGVDILVRVLCIVVAVGVLGFLLLRNLGLAKSLLERKAAWVVYTVLFAMTVLLLLANIVILILLSSSIPMIRYYLAKESPYLLGFGFALSLAFVVPHLTSKVRIAIVVGVYFLCGVLLVAVDLWHAEPFTFASEPVVFDTGDGYYSIVWSTSDISQGYVRIEKGGEETVEVPDANYGRMVSNRTIHHVRVRYEQLDGAIYTVCATRMLDNAPYFAKRGATITASRTFAGRPQGDLHMAVITDNHCLSRSKFTKVRQDDYNVVVMLGDFSDFVHQELDISDFLLYPAAYLSHGEVPVLYAKGNHDTHSEMGADLAYLLGFESLYYQATYGDYTFTVLDSGSCNVDLEEEKYAGLGRYIPYREAQLDWMSTLAPSAHYDVAIVHVWDYASVAEGTKNAAAEAQVVRYNSYLQAMGVDFQLSGHKHDWAYFESGTDGVSVPVLRCGGISSGLLGHSLTYTVLTFHDGVVSMTAYNTASDGPVGQATYDMNH